MTKPSDTEPTGSRNTGGNVVSFKRLAGPSVDVKESDGKRRSCQHLHVEIWTDEPVLGCVDCGAVVDPHEWIRRLTRDWKYFVDRLAYERREAEAEMRDLRKQLRVLRGEYESEREKREAERAICTLPPRRRLSDDGASARRSGKRRVPPAHLSSENREAWLCGWDHANDERGDD